MQNLNKYFWDQTLNSSITFKTRRLLEYASFPDLLKIPFGQVKREIFNIELENLRTSQKRIAFLKSVKDCVSYVNTWDEALMAVCGFDGRKHQRS